MISSLFALCVGNMMILNVASFLPTFVTSGDIKWKDGVMPSSFDVTLIISIFSVAQIVFAPFNAVIKNRLGSKNAIILGFLFLSGTTFGIGLLADMPVADEFKYTGMALRFFQGAGDILLQITIYTVVSEVFSDNLTAAITKIEITVGLGLGLGPFIGGVVYNKLGFKGTMFMFGGLNSFALVMCFVCMPNALNKTASEEEMAEFEAELEDLMAYDDDDANNSRQNITLWTILTNRHSCFSIITCLFGTFNISFWTGFIANTLTDVGLTDSQVGYVFALMSFTYLIACLLLPCTCEHSPRKFQFFVSFVLMGGCMILMGPSKFLDIPVNKWIMISAFVPLGICQVFVFIPIIPEMLERLQVDLNIREGEDPVLDGILNDKVNDAYGLIYALANFISPLIGDTLYNSHGQ